MTRWAWQVDDIAHGGSVRLNDQAVNDHIRLARVATERTTIRPQRLLLEAVLFGDVARPQSDGRRARASHDTTGRTPGYVGPAAPGIQTT